MLQVPDVLNLGETCIQFSNLIEQYCLLERRELICFHSKKNFNETVLGIGINVETYPG
jgi:hypothetical protein